MARIGDPCFSCGRKEPDAKFTKVRGKNQGTRRERPVWYRPLWCDSCRRPKKATGNHFPTWAAKWAQEVRDRGLAKGARCDFTMGDWRRAVAYFEHRCAYCLRKRKLTRDHVQPVIRGGEHTASNIVPACGPCNVLKDDQPLETFADPATVERIRPFFASLDIVKSQSGKEGAA